jgi:hypothetical protein
MNKKEFEIKTLNDKLEELQIKLGKQQNEITSLSNKLTMKERDNKILLKQMEEYRIARDKDDRTIYYQKDMISRLMNYIVNPPMPAFVPLVESV